MENLKVKNVIISKQIKQSDNYKRFLEIVKKKHINVILVKIGDRVKIKVINANKETRQIDFEKI